MSSMVSTPRAADLTAQQVSEILALPLTYEDEKDESSSRVFSDLYEYCELLGKGAFGLVISAFTKSPTTSNRKKVAVKIVDKRPLKKLNIEFDQEAKILNQLSHPNIVRLYASYESSQTFTLVMEYFEGVSLSEFIQLRGEERPFSDTEVRMIIEMILQAIQHMHSAEVLHRDLKPDNILIRSNRNYNSKFTDASATSKQGSPRSIGGNHYEEINVTDYESEQGQAIEEEERFEIRIIDFGLSYKNEFSSGRIGLQDNCGTLIFMAPEVAFNRQYQRSVDLWSCGIIQYMLFTMGKHPLWTKGDDKHSFTAKLKSPNWRFPPNMDEKARSFFLKTAAVKIEDRMTAAQCLKHVWIRQEGSLNDPTTMNEFMTCFSNQETLLRIMRCMTFLNLIRRKVTQKGSQFFKTISLANPMTVSSQSSSSTHSTSVMNTSSNSSMQRMGTTTMTSMQLQSLNRNNTQGIGMTSSSSYNNLLQTTQLSLQQSTQQNLVKHLNSKRLLFNSFDICSSNSNSESSSFREQQTPSSQLSIDFPLQQGSQQQQQPLSLQYHNPARRYNKNESSDRHSPIIFNPQSSSTSRTFTSSGSTNNINNMNNKNRSTKRLSSTHGISSPNSVKNLSETCFTLNNETINDVQPRSRVPSTFGSAIAAAASIPANSTGSYSPSGQSSPLKLPPINLPNRASNDQVISHRATRSMLSGSLSPSSLNKPNGENRTLKQSSSSSMLLQPNKQSIGLKSQFFRQKTTILETNPL